MQKNKLNGVANSKNVIVTPQVQSVDTNGWVYRLQTEIVNQGFGNIAIDNIAGNDTLSHCPTLKRGAVGNITRLLQEKLNSLGYDCGSCDGDFGGMTASSLSRYQSDNGLENDSICGRNSWSKLLGLS